MFRSIRWTLQLWHAVLLLLVVCIFGATLYFRLRYARLEAVDTDLRATAEVLAARLHPPPPPRPRDQGPGPRPRDEGPRQPPPPREEGPAGRGFGIGLFRGGPADPDSPEHDEFERRFQVPPELLRRFQSDDPNAPYFAIWRSNGQLLTSSRPSSGIPAPMTRPSYAAVVPPQFRTRGPLREVIVPGPFAMQVLVGRSIQRELNELRQLLWLLAATGAAVMIVGLAGGWWLSGRAIRPIRAITATARNISAANLAQRIDLRETENELGELAGVLNAMFARLEAAFERQTRFTADASHELRTPLAIIYSHTELARTRPRTAEEYRQVIDACFRAAKRMRSLVDSLLVLARADAGRLEIKCETFDLAQVVEECVDLVRPLAAERGIRIDLELRPLSVDGDTFRLAQVVTNLLTNAIHYNRPKGWIAVALKSLGDHAVLSVADSGVGIAEQDQPHVFERFYRVDTARSRELGGSGLGLAICKSIIEAHGGTIAFTSMLGEGTTFVITLPQAASSHADGNGRPSETHDPPDRAVSLDIGL